MTENYTSRLRRCGSGADRTDGRSSQQDGMEKLRPVPWCSGGASGAAGRGGAPGGAGPRQEGPGCPRIKKHRLSSVQRAARMTR